MIFAQGKLNYWDRKCSVCAFQQDDETTLKCVLITLTFAFLHPDCVRSRTRQELLLLQVMHKDLFLIRTGQKYICNINPIRRDRLRSTCHTVAQRDSIVSMAFADDKYKSICCYDSPYALHRPSISASVPTNGTAGCPDRQTGRRAEPNRGTKNRTTKNDIT